MNLRSARQWAILNTHRPMPTFGRNCALFTRWPQWRQLLKGDSKAAAATLSSRGVAIIDEISPHVWEGPNTFDMYPRAYAAFEQAEGITDEVYKPDKPMRVVRMPSSIKAISNTACKS
jgi:hypothetical protein